MIALLDRDLVLTGNHKITDVSFNLAEDPTACVNEGNCLVELHYDINVAVYLPDEVFSDTSRGFLKVYLSQGKNCYR